MNHEIKVNLMIQIMVDAYHNDDRYKYQWVYHNLCEKGRELMKKRLKDEHGIDYNGETKNVASIRQTQ